MLLRINPLQLAGSTALLRRCVNATRTSARFASTAPSVDQRHKSGAPEPPQKAPGVKPLRYINPEDHQAPEPGAAATSSLQDDRMQIYHCGAPRATVVATIKVTNLLVLAGFYGYAYSSGAPWIAPNWVFAAVGGQITWTAIWAYVSSPLVVSMWIKAPRGARTRPELMTRWLKDLSPDTAVEFTTFRIHGAQKTTAAMLKTLRPYKSPWWRAANLERVDVDRDGKLVGRAKDLAWWRKWIGWTAEPRNRFYVDLKRRQGRAEAEALARIFRRIQKNTGND